MTSNEEKIENLKMIRDKVRKEQSLDNQIYEALKQKRNDYQKKYQESFEDEYDEDDVIFQEVSIIDNIEANDTSYFEQEDIEYFEQSDDDIENDASEEWDYEDEPVLDITFNGKNLENGEFNNEDLENANFSVANLSGVNFSGSNLRGVDFSGANLTNTDLSGADLTGAIFAGSQLIGTNFTGAIMNKVVLTDVYFENVNLTDIEIDSLTLEDLQALIEYLALYYPHKLNLARINLTMLDLTRIDLSRLNLRGVDFTGVDFTGINISELDLSECIISPAQIAQALGRLPTPQELKKILAPKKKFKKGAFRGLDFSDLFKNLESWGVKNYAGFNGMSVDKLVKVGKKAATIAKGYSNKVDNVSLEQIKEQNRINKEELRTAIEQRKKRVLNNHKNRFNNVQKANIKQR